MARALVEVKINGGQFDSAAAAIAALPTPALQADSFVRLSIAYRQAGEADKAKIALNSGLAAVATLTSTNERSAALVDLVSALLEASAQDDARTVSNQIPDVGMRAVALAALARDILGHSGYADAVAQEGLALAFTTPESHLGERDMLLSLLVPLQSSYVDVAATQLFVDEIRSDTIQGRTWARTFARVPTKDTLLATAYQSKIDGMIVAITEQENKASVLAEMGAAQAARGEITEARSAFADAKAKLKSVTCCPTVTQEALIGTLVSLELFAEALGVASDISFPYNNSRSHAEIAAGQANAGHLDDAIATAALTTDFGDGPFQSQANSQIAPAIAKSGDAVKAVALAESIPDDFWRALGYAEVAAVLAGRAR